MTIPISGDLTALMVYNAHKKAAVRKRVTSHDEPSLEKKKKIDCKSNGTDERQSGLHHSTAAEEKRNFENYLSNEKENKNIDKKLVKSRLPLLRWEDDQVVCDCEFGMHYTDLSFDQNLARHLLAKKHDKVV